MFKLPFYAEAQEACGLQVTVGPPKGFADLRGFSRTMSKVNIPQIRFDFASEYLSYIHLYRTCVVASLNYDIWVQNHP